MLYRLTTALALAAIAATGPEVKSNRDPDTLVVHEWGTFTSIADQRGEAMAWQPLQGPDDLPCFVERFRRYRGKGFVRGTVRMETPVLYFYAPKEMTVDVSVRFPRGLITEWFPHAEVTPAEGFPDDGLSRADFASRATWAAVKILPRSREDFPVESGTSHYYLARRTDAVPVETANGREKFLFYRGVADVGVPITALAAADGSVQVSRRDDAPLGTVVLFERRGDRLGFEMRTASGGSTTFQQVPLSNDLEALTAKLEGLLVTSGLYAKEAAAMVNTWRDSWFEEGTRVFYVLPEAAVDAMLPLEITPRPARVARVFVGRMEVITPRTRAAVTQALTAGDAGSLRQYGRFLVPISEMLLAAPHAGLGSPTSVRQRVYSALAATTTRNCQ